MEVGFNCGLTWIPAPSFPFRGRNHVSGCSSYTGTPNPWLSSASPIHLVNNYRFWRRKIGGRWIWPSTTPSGRPSSNLFISRLWIGFCLATSTWSRFTSRVPMHVIYADRWIQCCTSFLVALQLRHSGQHCVVGLIGWRIWLCTTCLQSTSWLVSPEPFPGKKLSTSFSWLQNFYLQAEIFSWGQVGTNAMTAGVQIGTANFFLNYLFRKAVFIFKTMWGKQICYNEGRGRSFRKWTRGSWVIRLALGNFTSL